MNFEQILILCLLPVLFSTIIYAFWADLKSIFRKSHKANELDNLQKSITWILNKEESQENRIYRRSKEMAAELGKTRPLYCSEKADEIVSHFLDTLDLANLSDIKSDELLFMAKRECVRRQRAIEAEEREKAARLKDIAAFEG